LAGAAIIALLAVAGIGFGTVFRTFVRTRSRLHLLLIPVLLTTPAAIALAWKSNGMVYDGVMAFILMSSGIPFLVWWAKSFTTRMELVAATGAFDPGVPAPSSKHQLLGAMGQVIQELARPIVAMEGPDKINEVISGLASKDTFFAHVRISHNGEFLIDEALLENLLISERSKECFLSLVDFLVERNVRAAGTISRLEFESLLQNRLSPVIEANREILIREGLLDRLASGTFSSKVSTGLVELDLHLKGGYPKQSVVLLCGPPSEERGLLADSFMRVGLRHGDLCLYVTSSQPPEVVKRRFGELSRKMLIVDCYTNRIREVPTISRHGNVITTPVEISVVAVAISRGLQKEPRKTKRAVVDILPTYLVFQSVEKLYLDLMGIIDSLRRSGYTAIFSLNPYYIKDEASLSKLQELFDAVIHVERAADENGIIDDVSIRVEKMPGETLGPSVFRIKKPRASDLFTHPLPSRGEQTEHSQAAVEA